MIDGGLRSMFHKKMPQVHWQAIESGGTGGGIPDSNGCLDGQEFWVEMKFTTGWALRFQPGQIGWIDRRFRAGGRVWIAVRQTLARTLRDEGADNLFLFYGGMVRELSSVGLRVDPGFATGYWTGGPARWNWPAINAILTGPCQRPARAAGAAAGPTPSAAAAGGL